MRKYSYVPKGLNGNAYGDLSKDEFISFSGEERKSPFFVHMVGITHPNADYFIKRKNSSVIVLEYIVEGKGVVDCEGKAIEVKAGDVVLLLPGKNHHDSANKENPYKKIWINFQSYTFYGIIHDYNLDTQFVFHSDGKMLPYFESLLKVAETMEHDPNVHAEFSKIVYSILADLASLKTDALQVTDIARTTYIIINNNIQNCIKVNDLAKRLNCSKAHLTNQFKKMFGVTPYQYILSKKITIAKSLLEKTTLNVCEISAQLTFKDEFHFSNVFKQKTGITPSQYRLQFAKKTKYPNN